VHSPRLKILILKPSSLGDVIQAIPVLRLLKLHFPKSEIYWWIDVGLAPLLKNDPDLAGIIPFERKRWSSPLNWNELLHSVMTIRSHRFDLVIDLQGLARSGAFAWLANGKTLIGVADSREGAVGFYDIAVPRPSYHSHAVDWYLAVLSRLNVPVHQNFNWIAENSYIKAVVEHRWNPGGSRWIIINPGARWNNKRWPAEHYTALVCGLMQDFPEHRFAILGGKSDMELGRMIAGGSSRCLDLTGKTTLPEMLEWIRLSDLVVTNDTGPMHVAAAMKKPVVAMFGPTEPRRTGPYGQIDQALQLALPCVPCMSDRCRYVKPLECLRAITPERVRAEVRRRLSALSLNVES
jgi:heptosyltransferase-1